MVNRTARNPRPPPVIRRAVERAGRAQPASAGGREQPSVAILLATFNGERFLEQQLKSFLAQSYPHWVLHVSDDGSHDATPTILRRFGALLGRGELVIRQGPGKGSAANFLSLACATGIEADYFAYADQDDVWNVDKLARGIESLRCIPLEVPALYCSRTKLIDETGQGIGMSPLFRKTPCFANALVQNIGGGNTMIFNRAARRLLQGAGPDLRVAGHDWWTYQVVSACGGRVIYDPVPTLGYRQHNRNVVGANVSWRARRIRLAMLFAGRFREWSDWNVEALGRLRTVMDPACVRVLDRFDSARNRSLLARVAGLAGSGVHRQTMMGTLGLVAAALFKKI